MCLQRIHSVAPVVLLGVVLELNMFPLQYRSGWEFFFSSPVKAAGPIILIEVIIIMVTYLFPANSPCCSLL